MNDAHIGDDAELYAVGTLNEDERARVDAHVATCSDCLRRLGEAEETVLALERPVALPKAPNARKVGLASRVWPAIAVAAALIVGFILPHPVPNDSAPRLAMLHSHFSHAQFSGPGPLAKVLYPRERSWYYVVVEGAHDYSVVGISGSTQRVIGSTKPHGSTSELFAANAGDFQRIELRAGSTVIETAQIR